MAAYVPQSKKRVFKVTKEPAKDFHNLGKTKKSLKICDVDSLSKTPELNFDKKPIEIIELSEKDSV